MRQRPRVDITLPVLNEVKLLQRSTETLVTFLQQRLRCDWRVVITDNGSTDGTGQLAQELSQRLPNVLSLRLNERGRGRALRASWSASDADVLAYMDIDLSTNLEKFPVLVDAVMREGYDLAIGSRLMPDSQVKRSLKREVLSRGYNGLVKSLFWNRFSDGQCGFKAIRKDVAHVLLPRVKNQNWFFDTELLVLAEHFGFRIQEVPVAWIEDLDSRVNLVSTVSEDVSGLLRMRLTRHQPLAQVPRRSIARELADAEIA